MNYCICEGLRLRANETRSNWTRSIFSVPMKRVSVGRVPMRRVPNRRGYLYSYGRYIDLVYYIFHLRSKIAQYETADNILVKMRQPHDSPTSSDDERNTD